MIHYTCDRCQQKIDTEVELRYEVNIVTQVVLDAHDDTTEGLDADERDHLHEVDALLQRVDDEECEQLCRDLYQSRRFDLCSCCYQKYTANPLASEAQLHVEFSQN